MVKGQTNIKRKALPEVPGIEGKELDGLDSEKGPTPYLILIPSPTQVTQDYHRQKHKQIIGQRYLGWMSLGGCQKILHSLLLLKLLCLLLYQISG
jgi:hypothetical protein